MKGSELIEEIRQLIGKHGDLEMGLWNEQEGEFEPVDNIRPRKVAAGEVSRFEDDAYFGLSSYELGDTDDVIDEEASEEGNDGQDESEER